jgi:uncharacterized protein with HEPN domain
VKDISAYLEHILQNIAHVERLAAQGKQHFFEDADTQAAILYYLHTMAESTTRLPEDLRATRPQVNWRQIRAFRNVIVHDYLTVDLDRVWDIIEHNLPVLRAAVEAMQRDLDTDSTPGEDA